MVWWDGLCPFLPAGSRYPAGPVSATGAAPIVVIGNAEDNKVAFSAAETLAQQLDGAVLIRKDLWRHWIYSSVSDACINDAVGSYLTEGVVPEDGLICD